MRNEFRYSLAEDPWAHRKYLTNFTHHDLLAISVFCLILEVMLFLVNCDVIYVTINYLINYLELNLN